MNHSIAGKLQTFQSNERIGGSSKLTWGLEPVPRAENKCCLKTQMTITRKMHILMWAKTKLNDHGET